MIPVIDMHCDTIAVLNGWHSGTETSQSGECLRKNKLHIDLTRMKKANYMCQSFALYTDLAAVKAAGETPFSHVLSLSETFDREIGRNPDLIRPVCSGTEIEANFQKGLMSALKTVEEGGVYEGKLSNLQELYRRGVRKSTLTWNYQNELGFPNPSRYDEIQKESVCVDLDEVHGLTETGIAFVEEMERMGMLIDISHLNDAGIRDVFLHTKAETPILASHSNARGQAFHPRNLSDDMLHALAERGGVCGINFCAAFLNERYTYSAHEGECLSRIEDMIAHMRYIQRKAGIDVIGLGTDFDGIGGALEIQGAGEMQKLAEAMEQAGFHTEEIEKIFYKNVLRVYKEVLG